MVGYGLAVLTLILISGAIALKSKLSWFQVMPVSVASVVSVLYIFGLFHSLHLGVLLIGACAVVSSIYLVKSKSNAEQLITHEFKILIYIFIGVFVLQIGAIAIHGDETSHWMTTVKDMLNSNMLSNNILATTEYKEYPPATALLEYFFVKLDGGFTPENHLRAMNIFIIAFMLPMVSNIKDKMSQNWIVAILLLFPTVFFYTYTESLVDCVLGILLALMLFIYYDDYDKKYKLCILTIVPAICVLTKQSGIALVAIAGVIILADVVFCKKYKDLILVSAIVISTIIAKISWNISLSLENTTAHFSTDNINLSSVISLLSSFGENEKQILKQFVGDFVKADPSMGLIKLSFAGWCVMLLLAGVYLYKSKCVQKKQIVILETGMIALFGTYSGYLLLMYFFTWGTALTEGSFYRYLGTCMLGFSLMLFAGCIRNIKDNNNYKYILIIIAGISRPEVLKLVMNPIRAVLSLF